MFCYFIWHLHLPLEKHRMDVGGILLSKIRLERHFRLSNWKCKLFFNKLIPLGLNITYTEWCSICCITFPIIKSFVIISIPLSFIMVALHIKLISKFCSCILIIDISKREFIKLHKVRFRFIHAILTLNKKAFRANIITMWNQI